jgi:hypothetical protein
MRCAPPPFFERARYLYTPFDAKALNNICSMKKTIKKIKRLLRIHLDIPSAVIILLIISLFFRPLLNFLFNVSSNFLQEVKFSPWFEIISLKVVCEMIAAMIIIPLILYFFRLSTKSMLVGKFNAFDIVGTNENVWGIVTLSYNMFSNKIRGTLTSTSDDSEILIEAIFDRGSYLRGHYIEKKKLSRRRMGAFLLTLDGEGDNYSGPYVFIDPADGNDIPKQGKAKWVKIK